MQSHDDDVEELYTMSRSDVERLVRVESGLQEVRQDLLQHGQDSKTRDDELKDMITALGTKIDDSQFKWRDFLSKNWKTIALVLVTLFGGPAAVAQVNELLK